MGPTRDAILRLIIETIDEINAEQEPDGRMERSVDAVILGQGSKLDSLGLVNLVIALEQRFEESFEVELGLMDEEVMFAEPSPLETVGSLLTYIEDHYRS